MPVTGVGHALTNVAAVIAKAFDQSTTSVVSDSYLVIVHGGSDAQPQREAAHTTLYQRSGTLIWLGTGDHITALFNGAELVEPGWFSPQDPRCGVLTLAKRAADSAIQAKCGQRNMPSGSKSPWTKSIQLAKVRSSPISVVQAFLSSLGADRANQVCCWRAAPSVAH